MSKSAYLGLFSLLVLMVVVSLVFHHIWTAPPPEDSNMPDDDSAAAYTSGGSGRWSGGGVADLSVSSSRTASGLQDNTRDSASSVGTTTEIVRRDIEFAVGAVSPPSDSRVERSAQPVRANRQGLAGYKTYVVKKGDTFWEISEKQLGHGGKWRGLYELNRGLGLVKNEKDLHPRQVIVLHKLQGD
jgi:nucleoid-associated protein YgaU